MELWFAGMPSQGAIDQILKHLELTRELYPTDHEVETAAWVIRMSLFLSILPRFAWFEFITTYEVQKND
jgi:hypothetical protein